MPMIKKYDSLWREVCFILLGKLKVTVLQRLEGGGEPS